MKYIVVICCSIVYSVKLVVFPILQISTQKYFTHALHSCIDHLHLFVACLCKNYHSGFFVDFTLKLGLLYMFMIYYFIHFFCLLKIMVLLS